MAVAAAEVTRHRDRLDQLLPRLAVGKMAGAVGTGAGFGDHAAGVEARVMGRLGLAADEAPTQIVGRDRIAEFTNFLALVASTAERLATEVRNLQRTEIGEVAEAFDEAHQVGSSTMAQKRIRSSRRTSRVSPDSCGRSRCRHSRTWSNGTSGTSPIRRTSGSFCRIPSSSPMTF